MKRLSLAAALLIAALCFLLWPRPQAQGPLPVTGSAARVVRGETPMSGHESLRPGFLSRLDAETAAFRRWPGEYAAATPEARTARIEDGKVLAAMHRVR